MSRRPVLTPVRRHSMQHRSPPVVMQSTALKAMLDCDDDGLREANRRALQRQRASSKTPVRSSMSARKLEDQASRMAELLATPPGRRSSWSGPPGSAPKTPERPRTSPAVRSSSKRPRTPPRRNSTPNFERTARLSMTCPYTSTTNSPRPSRIVSRSKAKEGMIQNQKVHRRPSTSSGWRPSSPSSSISSLTSSPRVSVSVLPVKSEAKKAELPDLTPVRTVVDRTKQHTDQKYEQARQRRASLVSQRQQHLQEVTQRRQEQLQEKAKHQELVRRQKSWISLLLLPGLVQKMVGIQKYRSAAVCIQRTWKQNNPYRARLISLMHTLSQGPLHYQLQTMVRTRRQKGAGKVLHQFLHQQLQRELIVKPINKLRYRVRLLQQAIRSFLACRRDRLRALKLVWQRIESRYSERIAKQVLARAHIAVRASAAQTQKKVKSLQSQWAVEMYYKKQASDRNVKQLFKELRSREEIYAARRRDLITRNENSRPESDAEPKATPIRRDSHISKSIHATAQKMQRHMREMRQSQQGSINSNGKPAIYHAKTRSTMLSNLLRRLQKEHVKTRTRVQKKIMINHRALESGGGRRFSVDDARNVLKCMINHHEHDKRVLSKTATIFGEAHSRQQVEAQTAAERAQARRWLDKPEARLLRLYSTFTFACAASHASHASHGGQQKATNYVDKMISLVVDAICEVLLRERVQGDEENECNEAQPYNHHELKNLLDLGLNSSANNTGTGVAGSSRRKSAMALKTVAAFMANNKPFV